MRRFWGGLKNVLDSAAFLAVTVLLYLMMASTLPVDVERGSLVLFLVQEHSSLRPWFPVLVAASLGPIFLAGVWIKRWDPVLPVSSIRNLLAALFLLMWANPLGDYVSASFFFSDMPKPTPVFEAFILLFATLLILFHVLGLSVEGRGEIPEVPLDTLRVVEYWFLGWTLFYASFAGLMMRSLAFDRENSPYILAGIGMAYWCFLLSLRVRRQAGLEAKGRLTWANLVAGLWVLCAVTLWVTFRVWG